ncbi:MULTISPECIES: META domain-containing protein [Cobetia]|uniref:META domain-containing protein n=1 Tax=Cobetia TaxID=204286 RepID=UPI00046A7D0F|nr:MULTISPECIES: META domain-containing protein [Cobetia]
MTIPARRLLPMSRVIGTSLLLSISLLGGCAAMSTGSDSRSGLAPSQVPTVVGTHWSFSATSSDEEAPNFLLQPPTQEQRADEEDDRLRLVGSNGCNRLMGPVTLDESRQTLDIGPLASTMKMCRNAEQSSAFNRMLEEAASYQVNGSGDSARLQIMDTSGQLLATFLAVEAIAE